ncbi:MAG: ABC transporter substrate-binding protein [Sphaerochaetaceae bacterium]|nr:ABC transporter substrate-binding protein [Spirochaetales bacterium]MDY5498527.1 ABC transporter substrate-binding protein [Sphaerochaetaceae bacterium]
MRPILSFLLSCALSLSLFAGGSREMVPVKVLDTPHYVDSRGAEIPLTGYQRIVSLGTNLTETICALGAEERLVGRTTFCNYPESVQSIPSIGTLWSPSIETIISLKPDLVVAGSLIDDAVLESLVRAGLNVCVINHQASFEGTYDLIMDLGMLLGEEGKAQEIVYTMRQQVSQVMEETRTLAKPRTYLAISFGEMDSAATGDTYLGTMIEMAGGENVAKQATNWAFSKEQLVQADPEVIILMNMNGMTMEETFDLWRKTSPYKDLHGRVELIDTDLVSRQGPRLGEALQQLERKIHP